MFIRSFLALLFFICVLVVKSFSQDYFETIYLPDSFNVYDLAVNNQSELFVTAHSTIIGANSVIFKSSDNGESWQTIYEYSIGTAGLIKINQDGVIYALAESGLPESALMKSSDNGLTWNYLYVPLEDNTWENDGLYIKGVDTLYVAQNNSLSVRLLRSYDEGDQWDTLFTNYNSSEIISSLAIGNEGELFIGLTGFFEETGGVYKSVDNGNTWNLIGLFSNMVRDLSYNTIGDLFITVLGGHETPGLYAIYENDEVISPVFTGPSFTGLCINQSDDLFAGNFYMGSVFHTSDYGITYNWITSGLPLYASITDLYIDPGQYLYATSGDKRIWKSFESTVTATKIINKNNFKVYPNPTRGEIFGTILGRINSPAYFRFSDLQGKDILSGKLIITNSSFAFDINRLAKGSYILNIFYENIIYSNIVTKY